MLSQLSIFRFIDLGNPWVLLALFALASAVMIWRLHAMEAKGFEGTVLGTLIMPYCSGAANLIFALVMTRTAGNGQKVLENCLVNNVTNLTLILGLSAIFCSAAIVPKSGAGGKAKKSADFYQLYRLDLLTTLVAMGLFTGVLWALAKDGVLDFYDGLVLVALFLFWQVLHVFEILKTNVRKSRSLHWTIAIDLLLIAACAYGIYLSVDHLVSWIEHGNSRIFTFANLGWLSGAVMVLPNAILAIYYARSARQDIVVSSQVGDAHICIPMCIGLYALFDPIKIPGFFQTSVVIILGSAAIYFVLIATLGRLQRWLGVGFLGAYAVFVYQGIVH
ncbi:MAG: sodium:calcium symporter [Rhodocyclaceae bacterium]|nr:MAG: sodium:calcium symporter [Rhodocyclaceae bacterium]